jgi:hypothetical protein
VQHGQSAGIFYCAKGLTLHSSKVRERRTIYRYANLALRYGQANLNAAHADFGELPIDMPQRR